MEKKFFYCVVLFLCVAAMLLGCSPHTMPSATVETINPTINTSPTLLSDPKDTERADGTSESLVEESIATTVEEPTEKISPNPVPDNSATGQTGREEPETAQLKFECILTEKDVFLIEDHSEEVTIESFCESLDSSGAVCATKYGLVDLDADGVAELVLRLAMDSSNDFGTLVIRYIDGDAVGYYYSYRQMINLKEDGTFGYSGGIADTGYARLVFTDSGWEYNKICNVVEDGDTVTFFCNGEIVSEAAYWQFVEKQDAKEGVEWIDYL